MKNLKGIPHKAQLVKRPIGTEKIETWLITTNVSKPLILSSGVVVENASCSTFVPGSTAKGTSKIHSSFLRGYTDEMAQQLIDHFNGNECYLIVDENASSDTPFLALSPSEYAQAIKEDLFEDLRDTASLQA